MRIATYNLHFGGKGRVHWDKIMEQYRPEVLMVQESYPPEEHLPPLIHGAKSQNAVWAAVEAKQKKLRWGSAVFVNSHASTPVTLPDFRGSVVGVEAPAFECPTGLRRPIRIFSVHAPTGAGEYHSVVNSILDMLQAFRGDCDLVIGGDFNLTISERHRSESLQTAKEDKRIQARLRDEFGLLNCWQAANPDVPLAQTLRWVSNPRTAYHCDGIFVPRSWERHLRSCDVLTGPIWDELSDHNPVIADFD